MSALGLGRVAARYREKIIRQVSGFVGMQSMIHQRDDRFLIPSSLAHVKERFDYENKEFCVPHWVYRQSAKILIHTTIARLKNRMIRKTVDPTALVPDLMEELLSYENPESLAKGIKDILGRLLPEVDNQVMLPKIRQDFFSQARNIKEHTHVDEIIEGLDRLTIHPLLQNRVERKKTIDSVAQFCRNFSHEIVFPYYLEGTEEPLEDIYSTKWRQWQYLYHRVVLACDEDRLAGCPEMFKDSTFVSEDFNQTMSTSLARVLNEIMTNRIGDPEKETRAGHMIVYRHAFEHLNNHLSGESKLGWSMLLDKLDACYGYVVLDANDMFLAHLIKVVDFLGSRPTVLTNLV